MRQTYLVVTEGLDAALRGVHRLPLGEYELLRALSQPGCAQRMAGLAGAVGLSPSGLTRAIDRLERRGLVQRQACPDDRRGASAVLTTGGIDLLQRATVTHDAALRRLLLDQVTPAEAEALVIIWRRLAGCGSVSCDVGEPPGNALHTFGSAMAAASSDTT